jgi:hypothetical protein
MLCRGAAPSAGADCDPHREGRRVSGTRSRRSEDAGNGHLDRGRGVVADVVDLEPAAARADDQLGAAARRHDAEGRAPRCRRGRSRTNASRSDRELRRAHVAAVHRLVGGRSRPARVGAEVGLVETRYILVLQNEYGVVAVSEKKITRAEVSVVELRVDVGELVEVRGDGLLPTRR